MEIIFIILTGVLMGAFNLGFFFLGYYIRDKKPIDNSVVVDKDNAEAVKEFMNWINYTKQ